MVEAEAGVTCTEAEECRQTQELEEMGTVSPRDTALPTPCFQPCAVDFRFLASRTVRE